MLDEIAKEKAGIIKVVKINTQFEQQLAAQFHVRGIPALILFQNGNKLNQISGAMAKPQLIQWIEGSLEAEK